jgi:N-acetylglucosamine kinase-like BadF-type ATPase
MILVADAGATKTSWALISNDEVHHLQTAGIHSLLHADETIQSVLNEVKSFVANKNLSLQITSVFFFGAGCQNEQASERLNRLFKPFFPNSSLHFRSDMEAACLAASANQNSWVFILGTGSNSCIWKDNYMVAQVPSGGFILGDEGSGAFMGKKLLKAWMRNQLPNELQNLIHHKYQLTYIDVIHRLYRGDAPNTYLASFVPFIHEHRYHSFIHQLVLTSFDELKKAHEAYLLSKGISIPLQIALVGSVAHYFKDELKSVFEPAYSIYNIVHRPIEGLVVYFQHQVSIP